MYSPINTQTLIEPHRQSTYSPFINVFSWDVRWIFSEKKPPSPASPIWVQTILPTAPPSCWALWAGERARAGYLRFRWVAGLPGGEDPWWASRSPLSIEWLSPSLWRLGVFSRDRTLKRGRERRRPKKGQGKGEKEEQEGVHKWREWGK